MAAPIPIFSDETRPDGEPLASGAAVDDFDSLLQRLVNEQSTLSAAETFSRWHDEKVSIEAEVDHTAKAMHTPAFQSHYFSLMPVAPPRHGEQYAFEVDLDACSGCKACVVACHNLNNLESDETWRKVGWLTSYTANLPIVQHLTTACHHCVEPACLTGCPVQAYVKDDETGIVKHLDDQCFGCKYCTMMCPYEVPQYSHTLGIVRKCDMCSQRLAHGEAPACVQACPNQAIRIRVIDKHEALEGSDRSLLPTAPCSSITKPTTRFLSTRLSDGVQPSLNSLNQVNTAKAWTPANAQFVSSEAASDQPSSGHLPLVGMLILTQASVGLWLILTVLFLMGNLNATELKLPVVIASVVGTIGVHLALLHLGRPWLAYRAILGWRTSWLSREAIAFGIYLFLAGSIATGLLYADLEEPTYVTQVLKYGMLLTTSVGLLAVYCSAMIYVATQRRVWNATRTLTGFFATTVALGLGSFALFEFNIEFTRLVAVAFSIACVSLIPQFIDVMRHKKFLHSTSIEQQVASQFDYLMRSGKILSTQLTRSWKSMWGLWILGTIGSSFVFEQPFWMLIFTYFSVACLFGALALNRWLYFRAVATARMPGAGT